MFITFNQLRCFKNDPCFDIDDCVCYKSHDHGIFPQLTFSNKNYSIPFSLNIQSLSYSFCGYYLYYTCRPDYEGVYCDENACICCVDSVSIKLKDGSTEYFKFHDQILTTYKELVDKGKIFCDNGTSFISTPFKSTLNVDIKNIKTIKNINLFGKSNYISLFT